VIIFSCKPQNVTILNNVEVLHTNQDQLTQIIIYDVFTPPVASRIYAYTSLASYEALRFLSPGNESLVEKMNDFEKMPQPEKGKNYNYVLAASKAFFTVVHKVVFSVDSLKNYEANLFKSFEDNIADDSVYTRSISFGTQVGETILKRVMTDNYLKSRSKAKYLGSNEPGKWRPTQPDYLDGVEWCWNTMKPLVLDSCSQFFPGPPPVFSTDTNSIFFKAVKEVYKISKNITEEQKIIAKFWDDNPFVIEHSGHLMFGNKKITPGGHWMGIASIAARQTNADEIKTAKTYALTAVALFEAFLSCWDVKYKWSYVRPVTVINESIEQTWSSLLQTPPFPEYTSGHSTITASAAAVLTKLYGDNFSYNDTSDLRYIGMQRKFNSFIQAADECSISRLYGGIHYRLSVDTGAVCGRKVGAFIIEKLLKQ
ncbi:MAG: vanadium-dependent haloperoxidase, partial [Chitinophagaceae bacterium]